jgi:hypothetical protein
MVNQSDFDHNFLVFLVFLGPMFFGVFIGYLIFWDANKNQKYSFVPWMFLFLGPAFVIWNTIKSAFEWHENLSALLILVAVSLLSYKVQNFDFRKAYPFFSAFAVLIVVFDIWRFAQIEGLDDLSFGLNDGQENELSIVQDVESTDAELPNIYHLLFDGYQADVFDYLLDEKLSSGLGGYINFKNNTTLFDKTQLAIPVIFHGRAYGLGFPYENHGSNAFNSPDSLLGKLLQHGYKTYAYFHHELNFQPNKFDEVFFHHEFKKVRSFSSDAFLWLWLYAYWPDFIHLALLPPDIIDRIKSGNLSPDGYPVVSLDAFYSFLSKESFKSSGGRYVFFHLILPHPPYKLEPDCSVSEKTDALSQFQCANKLMIEFSGVLKKLGRFKDSLVIIQADHGDNLIFSNGRWMESKYGALDLEHHVPRAKALLLVKHLGTDDQENLVSDDRNTNILDIAPTILSSIGVSKIDHFDGVSLIEKNIGTKPRYFYIDSGREFDRYLIKHDKLEFDKKIPFR